MALSFVGNALGGTTTTTSFSITLPATQAGDIIILEFTHRGTGNGTIAGTYTGPAFALKHSQLYASSAFSGKTYWSRATGNHSGQTVTGSGLTNSCAAIVTVYRGAVASGDPLSDATIIGEQNAIGDETQAEISTATAGAWVVLMVVNSPDLAISTQACTSPGALTERAERLSTGGTDTSIAHASAEKVSAGGTGAFTWAQTNAVSGSWAYAIKPALQGAQLEGAVSGLSTIAAALTTAIACAGSLVGAATVAAALSTGIPLAASTSGSATGSATLSTEIRLAAAPSCAATVAADLAVGTPIEGSASCWATTTGALTTQITPAAAVSSSAVASGSLSTQIPLAGPSACTATVAAGLTSGVALASSVSGAAMASGGLSTSISLESHVSGAGTAAAELGTGIALAGALAGLTSAQADLSVGSPAAALEAAVSCGVTAGADLATGIALAGSADCSSITSAILTTPSQPLRWMAHGVIEAAPLMRAMTTLCAWRSTAGQGQAPTGAGLTALSRVATSPLVRMAGGTSQGETDAIETPGARLVTPDPLQRVIAEA